MEPRSLGPPARHVSPVTVTYSTVTAAGSQQGPAVPQPQNYGGNPYLGIPKANFLPQQGQTTAQQASKQQRQQQYLMNGQNDLSAPNQYEVYTPFQQKSFNQQRKNSSRPALVSDQNYGVQDLLGFDSGSKIQRIEEPTAQTTSNHQQHQHQLQYQQQLMNEQMAPHENKAYMSYQQPHSNQELRTPLGQAVFYPQYNGAQAPWGLHSFIQQNGHTTLQPALQQQQPYQQHRHQYFMKGQNERMTPHQNDAAMPSQGPKFDQFMTTFSKLDRRWDSLDCKTRQLFPPSSQLDWSMENMSTSAAIPMENLSASPVYPMGNMSASPAVPIGNICTSSDVPMGSLYTSPAIPMGNISVTPAVPIGNMSASPAVPMGNISTSPVDPMGNMSTSPSGPTGNLSASPADSIGNDHRILHDLNQRPCSQPLNLVDDSCSQFPIMTEKREYGDSIGENENIILAKRPKTDVDTDRLCSSVNNQDLSGDDSGRLDSRNNKDPLSDLTKEQHVVLYTFFLCQDSDGDVEIRNADSVGDIDIMTIVKELENKGLVIEGFNSRYKRIPDDKKSMIMKSYRENCLLSEIDKDFFIQVASDKTIETYAEVYCRHGDGPRESEDIGPITAMRLIVEGRGLRLPDSVRDEVFKCLIKDEKEFGMFVKFWCKARNTDPITLSDQIPDEKVINFYSAFTILSEIKNELMEMHLSKKKWSTLVSILLSEEYFVCENIPWEEKRKNIQQTFKAMQDGKEENTEEDLEILKELEHCDKLLTVDKENNTVSFVSEEIRHQVMGYFVLNCLESKGDYENYLKLSSVNSIFEYARPLTYERRMTERCMYLPYMIEELFVDRLGVDAIQFAANNYNLSIVISSKLHIPREVLKWDYDARCRYIACAKKGTQTMHRARAMIVGCAGAGKTTLLKRLQQRSIQELRQIQSTVGLEVYENLFDIDRDRKCLKGLEEDVDTENKCLLSVVDFAGQCAYYACHQVYLSRRAFYLLVIDMSKRFDEKVDQALCEQEGTMFSDWTFGQYVIFWLKSIHTYCEDDTQVVTLGTHSDEVKNMFNRSIYDDLLELLKNEPDLKKHLDRERCFHIGFPKDDCEPLDKLTDVVECIASIALEDRWRENIPKDWAYCEVVLRQNKQSGKKCISLTDFRRQVSIKKIGKEKETFDVLRFYHDIGVILYYNEVHLKKSTITDVQWFVDCFKYIITDPKHARDLVKNDKDWTNFFKSGYLSEELLKGIWKKKKMDARKCISTLKYMQRLGLLAVGKDAHYVPCMNKLDFGEHLKCYITHLEQKTSFLVFNFRFLPYFFYFRLIVACIVSTEWTIIEDNGQKCLFKNIALFKFKEHLIGVAVTTSTIQVQIFRQGIKQLIGEITRKIKKTMECILEHLTKNFHKKTLYEIGYQCSKQDVTEEDDLGFISEQKLVGRGEFSCPNHGLENYHVIKEKELLLFWKYDSENKANQEDCTNAPVGKSPSQNYDKFTKLIDMARKSLQIYFDKIFPSKDIVSIFTKNKVDMEHGQYKFNKDQLVILFPTNGTSPSSSAFDVTIMYKLLRNYGLNVQEPLVGWGNKPEVGKKSETDDVERIRHYRNMVVHQTDKTMEQEELDIFWKDLSQAIMRLSDGTLEKEIKALKMQK
ncbi:uncharacterized protein LOC134232014 isoform X2 [Saccostrea cucullata]|uniref:uncharacterized protein LOC134232014 isoform X2 n=1 Tax=Saccostrea cuccullata TaxID=36930 RepID=UPI002ED493C0